MSAGNEVVVLLSACVCTILYCDTHALSAETELPSLVHPFYVGTIDQYTSTPIELIDRAGTFGLLRRDGSSIAVIDSRSRTDPRHRIQVSSHGPRRLGFFQWTALGTKLISVAGEDIRILRWPDLHEERKWTLPHDPIVTCIEVSTSGKLIAVGCVENLFVIDTNDDAPRLILEHRGYPTDIAFSPDDSQVAYAGPMNPALSVCDAQSGERVYPSVIFDERKKLNPEEREFAKIAFFGVAYSCEGHLFGACGVSNVGTIGELQLWDWKKRRHVRTVRQRGTIFRHIVFNDDSVVYLGSCAESFASTGSVLTIDTTTGRHTSTFVGLKRPGFTLAIAREGGVLAAASSHGELCLWKTDPSATNHK